MSNFLAPAIAVILLPFFSTIGVVIAYTALYVAAFFLCAFIRVEQPGFPTRKRRPRAGGVLLDAAGMPACQP
jgi:hypothetical protein